MTDEYDRIREAADFVRGQVGPDARLGLVLGSGLGGLVAEIEEPVRVPFERVPHWPRVAVAGHEGSLVAGRLGGVPVAALAGRAHYYEGWSMAEVARPVRTLALAGCRAFVLTNAAGGIRDGFRPGDVMLVTDHLNLMGGNPLRGANLDGLGPRFPDMTAVHERAFADAARAAADAAGVVLRRGVYAALAGPSFETPAEIRMLRVLGADAVGMSTVPEVIALRHAGAKVLVLSLITNLAAGLLDQPLTHEEVTETGARVEPLLRDLLRRLVRSIGELEGIS
ncbi:MAG: purine-nucleoside phosphorylase [Planctomycetes bacterium]|jgi:purine-nucleoside phosphorylase|nr:purine-nucleoside phosphorylase [Planctomycetota bacterium]